MNWLASGVSCNVVPFLSAITDQPVERVVALLNNSRIIRLSGRANILVGHPWKFARPRRFLTKLEVSDAPMNPVDFLVGGMNLGVGSKPGRRNEITNWIA